MTTKKPLDLYQVASQIHKDSHVLMNDWSRNFTQDDHVKFLVAKAIMGAYITEKILAPAKIAITLLEVDGMDLFNKILSQDLTTVDSVAEYINKM